MSTGMAAFLYEFEWDPVKAKANFTNHGVDFERAAQVFRDPLALTIPDEEHSESEVRWITLGKDTHPDDLGATPHKSGSARLRGRQ
jgi:uncharacterized DUF497 family protein